MDNKSLAHTRWKCQYHIVFIPKYRKKVLYGRLRNDVREIISTLCKYQNVEIVAGAVCVDHVHISVAIPPFWASSNIALMRANTNHHLKWWLWISILKQFIKHLTVGENEVVLLDMEAGVEHFGRGVDNSVDLILSVIMLWKSKNRHECDIFSIWEAGSRLFW